LTSAEALAGSVSAKPSMRQARDLRFAAGTFQSLGEIVDPVVASS
jgi:hypothetical protein